MEDYEGDYFIKNFKYDRPDICDENNGNDCPIFEAYNRKLKIENLWK